MGFEECVSFSCGLQCVLCGVPVGVHTNMKRIMQSHGHKCTHTHTRTITNAGSVTHINTVGQEASAANGLPHGAGECLRVCVFYTFFISWQ